MTPIPKDFEAVFLAIHTSELPPLERSILTEPTMTPGIFYHGSPRSDIARIEPRFDARIGAYREVYFSQIPTYSAAVYAATRGYSGNPGRLYEVELVTRNVITMPPGWKAYMAGDTRSANVRDREWNECMELRDQGYDCVISEHLNGMICELVVFDAAAIHHRSTMGPVAQIAQDAHATGSYYAVDELLDPEYAPGSGLLFSARDRADAASGGYCVRPVRVQLHNPLYCDQASWPWLNLHVLKRFRIDSLIDPHNGDVLTLDRRLGQLNRAMRRRLRRTETRFPAHRRTARAV